jgi:surface antigen
MPLGTAVVVAVLTLAGWGLWSAGDARADGLELCSGYAACSVAPYTTHGYPAAEKTSWWRMYPGNNCTNYVAFVESQVFGVSDPSYLLGDAYQWAATAAANGVSVDTTPTVGAVAFWGSHALGMGRYGHVAVVEAVGPDDSYVDVSQSGMGRADDGYNWERIYAAGSAWETWPDEFIHFVPVPAPAPAATPAGPPPPTWPGTESGGLAWDGSATLPGPLPLPGTW